jgi:hypothetical protein
MSTKVLDQLQISQSDCKFNNILPELRPNVQPNVNKLEHSHKPMDDWYYFTEDGSATAVARRRCPGGDQPFF